MSTIMAAEIDEISRLLGQIESTVGDLNRRFGTFERRIDDQDDLLAQTAEHVRYLKDVVINDIKPVTDEVTRWKFQGLGALGVIGIGGAAFGAAILWLLNQLGWVKVP